jgi:hypothetical protein
MHLPAQEQYLNVASAERRARYLQGAVIHSGNTFCPTGDCPPPPHCWPERFKKSSGTLKGYPPEQEIHKQQSEHCSRE